MLKSWTIALAPAFLVCSLGLPAGGASHEKSPTAEEVVKRLGYSEKQIEELKQGKIIAIDLKRERGDQLIAAVAARIEAPLATLAGNLKKGLNIERDPGVMAFGAIPDAAENYGFEKFSYDSSDSSEIKRFIKVKANDTLNLGADEIAALQESLKGVKADDAAAETVSKAYREVLKGRLNAYLKGGLEGIEPYDHGGSKLSPKEQLETIYKGVEPFLSEFYPTFRDALGKFPQSQSPEVSSKFYWIKRKVEGRPAVILAHQLVQSTDDYFLISQRQFFVGHTYESLQVVALGLPVEGGTGVFYVNSAFTDQVTGFFSSAAHSVGQGRLKDDLESYFEDVRKAQPN